MNYLALSCCLLLFPFAAWIGVLLVQVACSMPPAQAVPLSSMRPQMAILVPAHNEAAGIGRTLQSLLPQLGEDDRILVVADNCDDDTASIAAAAGAEVVERKNVGQRGKGYALEFGMQYLALDAPEIVVFVDADCVVHAGAIDCLGRACSASARPVQSLYLMKSTATKGALGQIREFAWILRNLVRPLGYSRLGQPCQLMGTGMAFPWPLIASVPLGNAHLVEDMQLGIDLARRRAAPLFCPQAVVSSEFPVGKSGMQQQRRRWEHGHLGMISSAPMLWFEAIRQKNIHLLSMVLDMSVPPLALLLLLLSTLTMVAVLSASHFAQAAVSGLWLALAAAILLAWRCHGRAVLEARSLILAPIYVLAKLPLYVGYLYRRQLEWVRSSRD